MNVALREPWPVERFLRWEDRQEDRQEGRHGHTDRGAKRAGYGLLPGIRRHVLPQQDRMAATVLERTADGWAESQAVGDLLLPELGVTPPFEAVYRFVRFG